EQQGAREEKNPGRPAVALGEPVAARRQPAPAVRRHRRRHPGPRPAHGGQSRTGYADSGQRQARGPRPSRISEAPGSGRRQGGALMAARMLDGSLVAQQIRREVGPAVAAFTEGAGQPPGLGGVLVGEDPASEIYIRNKLKSAAEEGLHADLHRVPATASLADV